MRFRSRPAQLLFPLLLSLAALFSVLLPVIMLSQVARAQEGALDKSEPKGITAEQIIKRFANKEKEFKEARDQYTFRQDVKVMTLDGDTPDGMHQHVFDLPSGDKGRQIRNVVFPAHPTLQRLMMTEEDFGDIENRFPF